MKKLRIALVALTMVAGSLLTSKTEAQEMTGHWIVTVYSLSHWTCTNGGGVCCPGWDC